MSWDLQVSPNTAVPNWLQQPQDGELHHLGQVQDTMQKGGRWAACLPAFLSCVFSHLLLEQPGPDEVRLLGAN